MATTVQLVLLPVILLSCVQTGIAQCDVAMIREAVLEVLQPFMNETRASLEAVRRDLEEHKTTLQSSIDNPPTRVIGNTVRRKLLPHMTRIEESVGHLARDLEEINEKVCNLTERIDVEAPIVREMKSDVTTLTERMTTVYDSLVEHNNCTTSGLAGPHTSLQCPHTDQLEQLCAKVDAMDLKLDSLNSAMNRVNLTAVESQVEKHNYRVSSTLVALQTKQDTIDSKLDQLDSKQDELKMKVMSVNSELKHNALKNVTQNQHDLAEYDDLHECGGTGGWRRVAYLDMTDPNTHCPSAWRLNTRDSKRTCDTGYGGHLTCDSVFFPVSGGAYNRVCGTIRGYYQGGDAFVAYIRKLATTIDSAYVSGVSLTHGSPRQHIWTFAAGSVHWPCFCDAAHPTPSFVGGDFFCESMDPLHFNPLWDGENCTISTSCCSFNNPPYFTKRLPNPTTDDLEVRQCQWVSNESPVEFIDLYTKFEKVDITEQCPEWF